MCTANGAVGELVDGHVAEQGGMDSNTSRTRTIARDQTSPSCSLMMSK